MIVPFLVLSSGAHDCAFCGATFCAHDCAFLVPNFVLMTHDCFFVTLNFVLMVVLFTRARGCYRFNPLGLQILVLISACEIYEEPLFNC